MNQQLSELTREMLLDAAYDDIPQTSLSANGMPEMHDGLIVASGLHLQRLGLQVSILTKDASITDSALLPVAWS